METIDIYNTNNLLQEAETNVKNSCFQEAIALYEKAINNNSTNYSAYYNLGAIYERLQENNKAKDIYKKGINTAKLMQNKSIETELSFTLLGLMD